MEQRKFEQSELAKALNVTPKTAHNYLNGHTKLYADQLPLIAKFLRVPIERLFDESVDLQTLEEPIVEYGLNTDYKIVCQQKDEIIKSKDDLIETLKADVAHLRSMQLKE